MSVKISYDQDNRMILSGLSCDCGCTHQLPTQDIYVGTGLLDRVPQYIRNRGLGTRCVLVADDITYEVAGRQVADSLLKGGFDVTLCVIRREGEMEPDERACGEVMLSLQTETEFLISVGSGSITDTTRVVAVRTGLPFVCIGTAPSMDGYTSVVAPLLLRGVKIHRAANCPEIIVCDLDILRTAPLPMVISGVGDVLGKYIAIADWRIGQVINNEPYCTVCGEMVLHAVNQLLAHMEEIRQKSISGMRILIEALLLAGITIMIIGHTRAVASVEHNVVHYWDMMHLLDGKKQPPHGTAVGIATLLIWPLFLRFAREDLSTLSLPDIQARRRETAAREQWMLETYKEEAARVIMKENPEDFLSWDEQERRIQQAQERFPEIQSIIADLPPFHTIVMAMKSLGAPVNPQDLGITTPILNRSMHCAKDYRTRYSLMKTLEECGLLQSYLEDYPLE